MKKKILTLIIVTILGISLTSCDVEIGSRTRHYNNKYDTSLDKEETIAIDNIKNIMIDADVSEVKVYSTEGDSIQLLVKKSNTASGKVTVDKQGDSVEIKEIKSSKILQGSNKSRKIDIAIPKSFNGNLKLDYGAGEVGVSDILCDTLDIDGGAGELNVNNVVFNELELDSGAGKVNVNLSKKCGNININGGVGEVNLSLAEVGGDLAFDAGVGEATIKIPENAPVDIRTSTGIGSCNISAKTSREKTYIFDIKNGVGEIKVTN